MRTRVGDELDAQVECERWIEWDEAERLARLLELEAVDEMWVC